MDNKDLRLAVLIDADNAPRTALREIMAEAAVYGVPTVKRIYGDWTSPNLGSWKDLLLEHAIVPIQQYAYTTGKNSTDSAMIIDAMDILYSGRCDGFVLVSSDSDFTRLAVRLREAGMKVYGMGERKTPQPFIAACDKFIYIEVIRAAAAAENREKDSAAKQPAPAFEQSIPYEVVEMIADSLETVADEDGYAFLGTLGNLLTKKYPDFDPRNYGFSKLSRMMESMPERFEVDSRESGNPKSRHIYVRDKKRCR